MEDLTPAEMVHALPRPITVDMGAASHGRIDAFLKAHRKGSIILVDPENPYEIYNERGILVPGDAHATGLPGNIADRVQMNMVMSWNYYNNFDKIPDFFSGALQEARRISRPTHLIGRPAVFEVIDETPYVQIAEQICTESGFRTEIKALTKRDAKWVLERSYSVDDQDRLGHAHEMIETLSLLKIYISKLF